MRANRLCDLGKNAVRSVVKFDSASSCVFVHVLLL